MQGIKLEWPKSNRLKKYCTINIVTVQSINIKAQMRTTSQAATGQHPGQTVHISPQHIDLNDCKTHKEQRTQNGSLEYTNIYRNSTSSP